MQLIWVFWSTPVASASGRWGRVSNFMHILSDASAFIRGPTSSLHGLRSRIPWEWGELQSQGQREDFQKSLLPPSRDPTERSARASGAGHTMWVWATHAVAWWLFSVGPAQEQAYQWGDTDFWALDSRNWARATYSCWEPGRCGTHWVLTTPPVMTSCVCMQPCTGKMGKKPSGPKRLTVHAIQRAHLGPQESPDHHTAGV